MQRNFIINWFLDNSSLSESQIKDSLTVNFFDKGIIDSFGFLGLIGDCEEQLGIRFTDEDFQDNRIFTINGLIELVESKKQAD